MRRHSLTAILLVLLMLAQKVALSAEDQGDASTIPATDAPATAPAAPTPATGAVPPTPGVTAAPSGSAPDADNAGNAADTTKSAEPPAPPTPPPAPERNIALVLPLDSKTYSRAADATREGFLAAAEAAKADNPLPVKVYPSDDSVHSLLDAYAHAVNEGASIVIGPITREGVTALARSGAVTVPTLALNAPDVAVRAPAQLLVLSLSLEAEARQMAQLAYGEHHRKAAVVVGTDALAKRMRNAFADEWTRLGGTPVVDYAASKDSKLLAALRSDLRAKGIDAVFLALDTTNARSVRPYLGNATTYATSRVYRGAADLSTNLDLKGIHFVEMPWLLLQQQPEVQLWPRSKKSLSVDLERFYALGVDAFRLSQLMLKNAVHGTNFAGVTGALTLDQGNFFSRLLPQASFDDNGQILIGGPMP